jgi:hypothetical protein
MLDLGWTLALTPWLLIPHQGITITTMNIISLQPLSSLANLYLKSLEDLKLDYLKPNLLISQEWFFFILFFINIATNNIIISQKRLNHVAYAHRLQMARSLGKSIRDISKVRKTQHQYSCLVIKRVRFFKTLKTIQWARYGNSDLHKNWRILVSPCLFLSWSHDWVQLTNLCYCCVYWRYKYFRTLCIWSWGSAFYGQGESRVNPSPHWDHGKNPKTHLNGHIRPQKLYTWTQGPWHNLCRWYL